MSEPERLTPELAAQLYGAQPVPSRARASRTTRAKRSLRPSRAMTSRIASATPLEHTTSCCPACFGTAGRRSARPMSGSSECCIRRGRGRASEREAHPRRCRPGRSARHRVRGRGRAAHERAAALRRRCAGRRVQRTAPRRAVLGPSEDLGPAWREYEIEDDADRAAGRAVGALLPQPDGFKGLAPVIEIEHERRLEFAKAPEVAEMVLPRTPLPLPRWQSRPSTSTCLVRSSTRSTSNCQSSMALSQSGDQSSAQSGHATQLARGASRRQARRHRNADSSCKAARGPHADTLAPER